MGVQCLVIRTEPPAPKGFFRLPPELRTKIYEFCLLDPPKWRRMHKYNCKIAASNVDEVERPPYLDPRGTFIGEAQPDLDDQICCCSRREGLGLLAVNRQIHKEAAPVFWTRNVFFFGPFWHFAKDVGETLRPEYRSLLRHVVLAQSGSDVISVQVRISFRPVSETVEIMWKTLLSKCPGLHTLEMTHWLLISSVILKLDSWRELDRSSGGTPTIQRLLHVAMPQLQYLRLSTIMDFEVVQATSIDNSGWYPKDYNFHGPAKISLYPGIRDLRATSLGQSYLRFRAIGLELPLQPDDIRNAEKLKIKKKRGEKNHNGSDSNGTGGNDDGQVSVRGLPARMARTTSVREIEIEFQTNFLEHLQHAIHAMVARFESPLECALASGISPVKKPEGPGRLLPPRFHDGPITEMLELRDGNTCTLEILGLPPSKATQRERRRKLQRDLEALREAGLLTPEEQKLHATLQQNRILARAREEEREREQELKDARHRLAKMEGQGKSEWRRKQREKRIELESHHRSLEEVRGLQRMARKRAGRQDEDSCMRKGEEAEKGGNDDDGDEGNSVSVSGKGDSSQIERQDGQTNIISKESKEPKESKDVARTRWQQQKSLRKERVKDGKSKQARPAEGSTKRLSARGVFLEDDLDDHDYDQDYYYDQDDDIDDDNEDYDNYDQYPYNTNGRGGGWTDASNVTWKIGGKIR